eukprot:751221-Hanusia_phi.AAC.3
MMGCNTTPTGLPPYPCPEVNQSVPTTHPIGLNRVIYLNDYPTLLLKSSHPTTNPPECLTPPKVLGSTLPHHRTTLPYMVASCCSPFPSLSTFFPVPSRGLHSLDRSHSTRSFTPALTTINPPSLPWYNQSTLPP